MHHQVRLVLQLDVEVLAAPPDRHDLAALDGVGELGRRRGLGPARVEHLGALDRPALDVRSQLAADRLDLRKLWHRQGF
jgi:hypothetical protein